MNNFEKPLNQGQMIRDTYTHENASQLREQFMSEYARMKGWDVNNLTTEQMLEITTKSQYKTPGMLKG